MVHAADLGRMNAKPAMTDPTFRTTNVSLVLILARNARIQPTNALIARVISSCKSQIRLAATRVAPLAQVLGSINVRAAPTDFS